MKQVKKDLVARPRSAKEYLRVCRILFIKGYILKSVHDLATFYYRGEDRVMVSKTMIGKKLN